MTTENDVLECMDNVHIRWRGIGPCQVINCGYNNSELDLVAIQTCVRAAIKKRQTDDKAVAIEIGTWVGESALAMGLVMPDDGVIYCIDHFLGSPNDPTGEVVEQLNQGLQTLKSLWEYNLRELKYYSNVAVATVDPYEAREKITSFPAADFVYIDGDHSYEWVTKDLEFAEQVIRPCGLIAGHDAHMDDVIRACQDFANQENSPYRLVVFECSNVWLLANDDLYDLKQLGCDARRQRYVISRNWRGPHANRRTSAAVI